jgi:hypothetical protein
MSLHQAIFFDFFHVPADSFGEVPSTAAGEQRHQAVRKEGVTENIRMVDIIFH